MVHLRHVAFSCEASSRPRMETLLGQPSAASPARWLCPRHTPWALQVPRGMCFRGLDACFCPSILPQEHCPHACLHMWASRGRCPSGDRAPTVDVPWVTFPTSRKLRTLVQKKKTVKSRTCKTGLICPQACPLRRSLPIVMPVCASRRGSTGILLPWLTLKTSDLSIC